MGGFSSIIPTITIDTDANQYSYDGSDILLSNDSEKIVSSTTEVKVKEIKITKLRPTSNVTLRIYFEHCVTDSSIMIFSRIKRNGVSVGVLYGTGLVYWTPVSQDLTGWNENDTIELWCYITDPTYRGKVRNFRVLGKFVPFYGVPYPIKGENTMV